MLLNCCIFASVMSCRRNEYMVNTTPRKRIIIRFLVIAATSHEESSLTIGYSVSKRLKEQRSKVHAAFPLG